MNPELNPLEIGQQLGLDGVDGVVAKVEEYCAHEERRITLVNEPRMVALRAEFHLLLEEERAIQERLCHAPPPGDMVSRKRKAAYYWMVTVSLTIAAFVFSLLAFDPYRLGWKSYLYCFGIAIVTPFLVEEVIERWSCEGLVKSIATVACIAALISLISLAVIRGDLLTEQVSTTQSVEIDDSGTVPPVQENTFYERTLTLLRLSMALLAIAIELGAGLALHRAWRFSANNGEDANALWTEMQTVRHRMIACLAEMKALENEPAIFVSRFWRNFYQAMLTYTVRNAAKKLLLTLMLIGLPLLQSQTRTNEKVTIVVALDLTQSVADIGPDGKSDYTKNVEAVGKLLSQAPPSSRIVVIGITDASFASPYILLSARVPEDAGYFGERLTADRAQLVKEWKRRTINLSPKFRQTDIISALVLASQLFEESPKQSRKMLIVFSDMRHHTGTVDLETASSVPSFAKLQKHEMPIAALAGVETYILGVDGSGKSMSYWQSLQAFWLDYFKTAGTSLQRYSVLREFPDPNQR